ncbi:L-lactate dehydrogenase complex protein LldG [Amorphus suaedae]
MEGEDPHVKAREHIIGKIQRALDVDPNHDEARRRAVAERLSSHGHHTIPARGQLGGEERIALFRSMVEAVSGSTDRVASRADVPAALARRLQSRDLPPAIRRGNDQRFDEMDWDRAPSLQVRLGPSEDGDTAGVVYAFAGIAETGTSVALSGADNPTTVSFLPEEAIILVDADSIAGDMEAVLAAMRGRFGNALPRTVNFITGPSRSADIEQTLLLGAHGPRALHVIVVG